MRALANYHRLVNEIERLIAAPLDGVARQGTHEPAYTDFTDDKE